MKKDGGGQKSYQVATKIEENVKRKALESLSDFNFPRLKSSTNKGK